MKFKCLTSLILIATISLASFAAATTPDLPVFNAQDHSKIKGKNLKPEYTGQVKDISAYQKIKLLEPSVNFRKYWERDQRRNSITRQPIRPADIEKIKSSLATEFTTIITASLADAGYQLSDEVGDDVLIIRPAIINLDITAPDIDSTGQTRSYTNTAGEMSLYLEYFDPKSAELIAIAVDQQRDPRFSDYYTWTTSVSNRAAARRMIRAWAGMLVKQLATANMEK